MRTLLLIATMWWLTGPAGWAARWQCELPGGSYLVDTGQIVSVSTHEYVVDAVARVTELTIATTSAVTARFYFIEPVATAPFGRGQELLERAEERAAALAERVGQEPVWKKVVKNYPTTTHAHMVEYRVDNKEQLQKLFDSVVTAWKQNKDVTVKLTPPS